MSAPNIEDSERTLIYFQVATATVCAYEYGLTFGEEIEHIWRRKLSIVSLLFVVSRYGVMCYNVLYMIKLAPWPQAFYRYATDHQLCKVGAILTNVMSAVIYSSMSLFAAIRTHALWDRDYRVLACVLIAGLGYPVSDIYLTARIQNWDHACEPSFIGCGHHKTFSPDSLRFGLEPEDIFHILGISSMLLLEVVTITLTWVKVVPDVRQLKRNKTSNIASYMSYIILYDGSLHFTAIVLTMALGLLGLVFGPFVHATIFTQSLASIMMSRFILDLRRGFITGSGNDRSDDPVNTHESEIRSLKFASNTTASPMVTYE